MKDKPNTKPTVQLRLKTYDRMQRFLKAQPLPPKAIDLVSMAVEKLLDEKEKA